MFVGLSLYQVHGFSLTSLRVWGLILPCPVKALDTVVIDIPSSPGNVFWFTPTLLPPNMAGVTFLA